MDPPINQQQFLQKDWYAHIKWLRAEVQEWEVRVAQLLAEANELIARANALKAPLEALGDAAEALAEAWADEPEADPVAWIGG
ncbi:unnamed protein product [Adineta steineri]|uniref:Uncharacterized protein n=1 Tax=Adineta steineri TaxID=433720 RepID=A0A813YTT2_9BILA|nr:unnamed protein product [Adineta steineri]CAF3488687.1 unnamed protein product [Adineta steineri]